VEYIIMVFRFFRAFKIFTLAPRAKSILDIGSGRGFTLYYLKKYYNYRRTAGTQISKNAFEFSRDKLRLEIYDKDILELSLENPRFDIITLWHVLEHVAEPEKYIKKIYDLLNDDGRLLIEVPNFDSWTRRITKKYWLGLDLNYHMTFFNPKSLRNLLGKYGFKIKSANTFSLEYSTFTSAQSIVSLLTRSDHLFFKSTQTAAFDKRIVRHIFLLAFLAPICLLINLLLYFSKKGEILLVIAEKERRLYRK